MSVQGSMSEDEIMSLMPQMNEKVVRRYFESRGFETKRLDTGGGSNQPVACDWFVQGGGDSFLCELKTIVSPQKGAKTRAEFRRRFENPVRDYFARKKSVRGLPYHLHFHCDGLLVPEDRILASCLKSISQLLDRIHSQEDTRVPWLFHDCCGGGFDLAVTRSSGDNLQVQVSCYGDLNLRAVEKSVGQAVKQLASSGGEYPGIARIAILALVSRVSITPASEVVVFTGLHFMAESLWRCIDAVLRRNRQLSSIAVMWAQAAPSFTVLHNPALAGIRPLDRGVFDDGRSVQFDSLDAIPRHPAKRFDLEEFTAGIVEGARSESDKAITLADYEAQKKENTRQG